ncbi:hypothetical protein HG535_0A01970 [Zygotorulaspora mrakii]|uniref:Transcription factor IIIC subunit 5 HTH domain-containing protein n=1 Tax=Zygotorulaspora mrakii TaxID=42260 RepID=A0A7H9AWU6_ZYGMR|nr:uncharacterized protein HG535_0A01970 [Zygotorulaspora mrakii]QLG70259.1 hypothetical protein HG535_0A01970 [Zygotorulaspora mrakii]
MDSSEDAELVQLSTLPGTSTAVAKEYTLDIPRIPSVELPLNISENQASVLKAINMCGGIDKIKEALNEYGETTDSQKGLELYMNESQDNLDYFNEHPIIGKKVPNRDESIVLKIQMPKGTLANHAGNVQKALASLDSRDVRINPVAIINNTIKFREMSDFQIRLDNAPSANEFKDSFGTLDWDSFKKYVNSVPDNDPRPFENISNLVMDRNSVVPSSDFQLPPPPRLSMVSFPLLYRYKTNPFATKKSSGAVEVKGTYIKNHQQFVHEMGDDIKIPTKPHELVAKDYEVAQKNLVWPGTKKESKFFELLQRCLETLHKLFDARPVWVKKHIDGIVDQEVHHTLKIALALISYRFTVGPWRNTYIKLGLDPRSSSEYAKYQTEYFKIERKLLLSSTIRKNIPSPPPAVFNSNNPGDIDSRFKFNGKQIPWYLMLQIDLLVEEPAIKEVYEKAEYLTKANELTGWFTELDLAKIRKIVKYELGCMVQGNYKFNQYKLKYFKTMLYVKESMMKAQGKDADGYIDISGSDTTKKESGQRFAREDSNVEDEDEDNGVETGEVDDTVLEAEEADDDLRVEVNSDDEGDDIADDSFDVRSATFQEIIKQIAKCDPEKANVLQKTLNGFISESSL